MDLYRGTELLLINMGNAKDNMEERKENKPLSFSISMILGDNNKTTKEDKNSVMMSARVPMATIHHYPPANESSYAHFGKLTVLRYVCKEMQSFKKSDLGVFYLFTYLFIYLF